MTRAIDLAPDVPGFPHLDDTVDGLPLVEHFAGEPTIETWLATLWGIRPGHSSPLGGLPTPPVGGSASPWLYRL
jgi:hypothetical protein